MATTIPDLWPDTFGTLTEVPPVTVLREQAARLGEKTGGLVVGEVNSRYQQQRDLIVHSFYLVVPTLDDYRYRFLDVVHSLQLYPASIQCLAVNKEEYRAKDHEEFVQQLREVLTANETTTIIQTLIAQAQSE